MVGLILFGGMVLLFALNAPVAVALGGAAFAAVLAKGLTMPIGLEPMLAVQRLYAGADSFPLLAVPLFMLAGELMSAGGISRRIVALADALVGHLPGGLAAVSVVSAMFFAGVSGSAAADTAAVGSILIPAMIRRGYPAPLAGAVQAAGGCIGVIIPPSIPMIVFGALTGASIGRLFAGGVLPGLLMGASLVALCVVEARRTGRVPERRFDARALWPALRSGAWALGAPAIILGTIIGGVATATESAAMAVAYALPVGLYAHRELRWRDLPRLALCAGVTSAVVMLIIAAASLFGWVMALERLPQAIAAWMLSLSGDRLVLLLLVNLLLLVVGAFLETTAAILLFVPVLVPLLPALGIDLVHLGIIVVVNLAIGMLTPPLGVCLVVSCSIARIPLSAISRAIVPMLVVLIVNLLLVTFCPPLVLWLGG